MIYRSSKREFDAGALMLASISLLFIIAFICITVIGARTLEYEHIEKMEQIKTCKEEE